MYKMYFKYARGSYIVSLIFMSISVFGNVMASVLLANVLNAIIDSSVDDAILCLTIMIIIWIIVLISAYIANVYQARTIKTININIKNRAVEKLSHLSEEKFNSISTDVYVSNLTKDTDMIEQNIFNDHFEIIYNIELAVISFLAILYFNIFLAISSALFFIILYFTPKLFENVSSKNVKTLSQANGRHIAGLRDQLGGFGIYSSYNLLKRFRIRLSSLFEELEAAKYKFNRTNYVIGTIMGFINMFSQFGNIIVTVVLSTLGIVEPGVILSIGNLSGTFYNSLRSITDLMVSIRSTKPLLEKLIKDEKDHLSGGRECPYIKTIELQNISFDYQNKNVIENRDFSLKERTRYLVMGENGSGKSTLLKLLGLKLKPALGSYRINDIKLSDLDPASVRSHIAYIDQEPYIFNDTILGNITLGETFDKKEVIDVIEKCNLTSFVKERGLDNIIGINDLSGGQRQKIAIARALIRKCQVFLCDEIASNLDQKSKKAIYDILLNDRDIILVIVDHQIKKDDQTLFDELIYM